MKKNVKTNSSAADELATVHQTSYDVEQMNRLRSISSLMMFQARMPSNPFMTRDEAYNSVGCGPHAAMFAYSMN